MLQGLVGILGLVMVGCYAYTVYLMFKNGEQTMGIISLVTILCGIGALIAFVYGWMKAGAWGNMPVMGVWTLCILLTIAINVLQVMGAVVS